MFRLSRWLCQGNVFVFIFDLVQHVVPLFCSGHWHNYFLQLGQAVRASIQSIFLRCLWFMITDHQQFVWRRADGIRSGVALVKRFIFATEPTNNVFVLHNPGNTKGGVSLYHWPPVWLVYNQLYDNWPFLFLFAKQINPNQSNRRSIVQW
jgi:hypothetical protein